MMFLTVPPFFGMKDIYILIPIRNFFHQFFILPWPTLTPEWNERMILIA